MAASSLDSSKAESKLGDGHLSHTWLSTYLANFHRGPYPSGVPFDYAQGPVTPTTWGKFFPQTPLGFESPQPLEAKLVTLCLETR